MLPLHPALYMFTFVVVSFGYRSTESSRAATTAPAVVAVKRIVSDGRGAHGNRPKPEGMYGRLRYEVSSRCGDWLRDCLGAFLLGVAKRCMLMLLLRRAYFSESPGLRSYSIYTKYSIPHPKTDLSLFTKKASVTRWKIPVRPMAYGRCHETQVNGVLAIRRALVPCCLIGLVAYCLSGRLLRYLLSPGVFWPKIVSQKYFDQGLLLVYTPIAYLYICIARVKYVRNVYTAGFVPKIIPLQPSHRS